jgi:hypothetical protein
MRELHNSDKARYVGEFLASLIGPIVSGPSWPQHISQIEFRRELNRTISTEGFSNQCAPLSKKQQNLLKGLVLKAASSVSGPTSNIAEEETRRDEWTQQAMPNRDRELITTFHNEIKRSNRSRDPSLLPTQPFSDAIQRLCSSIERGDRAEAYGLLGVVFGYSSRLTQYAEECFYPEYLPNRDLHIRFCGQFKGDAEAFYSKTGISVIVDGDPFLAVVRACELAGDKLLVGNVQPAYVRLAEAMFAIHWITLCEARFAGSRLPELGSR